MLPRIWAPIALTLLIAAAPAYSPVHAPTPHPPHQTAWVLQPEIDHQLQAVAILAHASTTRNRPDPRLFGALLRLEEMLPRSLETREAQERGRKLYLAMLSSRSPRLAARWAAAREAIERVMRRDVTYMQALQAMDRRLSAGGTVAALAPPAPPRRSRRSLPFDEMRPGDIMIWDDRSGPPLVRIAISMYAAKCTHCAVYLGERSMHGAVPRRMTFEAQSPSLGVRASVMSGKWTRRGLHVALGHVRGFSPEQARRMAESAIGTYGVDGRTPYHVWPPWDKTYRQDGMYCSQLVWSVYEQHGVDLDSNDWHYLAWFTIHNWFNPYASSTAYFGVFPDEIKASPQVDWYYDQANL